MILQAFAKTIHKFAANVPPMILLNRWLRDILKRSPKNNVEKIIHTELIMISDDTGMYAIVGKTANGQKLLENLYKFVGSLENHDYSRWLHNLKANEFKNDPSK